jgi:hypothetical protein
VPRRSYPLFRAREVLEYLAAGGDGGSPLGYCCLPRRAETCSDTRPPEHRAQGS